MTGTALITGGSGLLGVNWALTIRDDFQVTLAIHQREIAVQGVSTMSIDLESGNDLKRALSELQPHLVVHAVGLTSVESCEANPELAYRINVQLAANVASACAAFGLPLVHISTDHLFSGASALVDENAPIEPRNAYARSKAEAEARVFDAHPRALVIRTNFFGWGPGYRRSFSDLIIDSLRQGETLTLFEDVFFTPIVAAELIRAAHQLQAINVAGIVNVCGDERVSKLEFGMRLASIFGLDDSLIRPGSVANQPGLVQRPHDMSLSNKKASALLGRELGGLDKQLAVLLQQQQLGFANEVLSI